MTHHVRFWVLALDCMLGNFHVLLSSADFFQNQLLQKKFSGTLSECQAD